jgi:hypothetical protein
VPKMGRSSTVRELISAADTADRWRLGEVTADADPTVANPLHPGEPEAIIILEGDAIELHGAEGIAIWPIRDRIPGRR